MTAVGRKWREISGTVIAAANEGNTWKLRQLQNYSAIFTWISEHKNYSDNSQRSPNSSDYFRQPSDVSSWVKVSHMLTYRVPSANLICILVTGCDWSSGVVATGCCLLTDDEACCSVEWLNFTWGLGLKDRAKRNMLIINLKLLLGLIKKMNEGTDSRTKKKNERKKGKTMVTYEETNRRKSKTNEKASGRARERTNERTNKQMNERIT